MADVMEVTLTCPGCPGLEASALYPSDTKGTTPHETTGLLAGIAARHATAHPDHAPSYRVETPKAAARRRGAEAADLRRADAEAAKQAAERQQRRGAADAGGSAAGWPF